MSNERIQKQLIKQKNNNYLARDFDSFRGDLLKYAKTYFPDKIADFSEASLGGLFLDMNAFIGDNLSFYLDHQFNELNPNTATESANIENHLRNAGVKIVGASPAVVLITLFFEVFAILDSNGSLVPDRSLLPRVLQGTIFRSGNGVNFTLTSDVDFSEVDSSGNLTANIIVGTPQSNNRYGTFIVSKTAVCISGEEKIESFSFNNTAVPFRTITISNTNVTEIIEVKDSQGNVYHEVESLSQSTVFRSIKNINSDNELVESSLELIPAPYRYIIETSLSTRITTIRFGSGDADSLDNDILPDPSEVAIPFYGKNTFTRFSLDPNSLLATQTLGISPKNTTVTIRYRHGGGTNHNVGPRSIRTVSNFIRTFPMSFAFDSSKHVGIINNDFSTLATRVNNSVDVINYEAATGGDNAPTLVNLRSRITASRSLQSRIVSKQDFLARVYTLPAKFGRVYRAAISENPDSSLSTIVYIISKNSSGKMTIASDTLKKNLKTYINEYRLISDAIDILDARVINYQVRYQVLVEPNLNKSSVLNKINNAIANSLKTQNFQINQPIVRDDVVNIIINQRGVISLTSLNIRDVPKDSSGTFEGRNYSSESFNFDASLTNGVFVGPKGSIFELRYPNSDILGSAV
jgi:hypothetical protein